MTSHTNQFIRNIFACILLVSFFGHVIAQNQLIDAQFKNPPDVVKLHTWWHWMDGNITKVGITKDLEAMQIQGIVQATILNIGLLGDRDFGIKKVNFNTPEWYEMFRWALEEANRLGISVGIHNCDGWSTTGGPWITPEMSMKQYVWTKAIVNASLSEEITLKQPMAIKDFYKDVAVLAIKSNFPENSFQQASPKVTINNKENTYFLFDGCPISMVRLIKDENITFSFEKSFTAGKIAIMPRRSFMWGNPSNFNTTYSISVSNDDVNYKKITEFTISGLNKLITVPFEKTTAKFYRLSLISGSNSNRRASIDIAECELLAENEKSTYANEIDYLQEKTSSVKAGNEECFYSHSPATVNNSVKEVIDLTSKMDSDGTLNWKPASGNWTIIRFGYTSTGATNGPATVAGVGLECDKMDTSAVNLHFNNFPAKVIKEAGEFAGNTFKFMLIDSWEAGFQNWTAAMMKEFEKTRGYSLTSYIPVLCGESSGNTELDEAVLFDFRTTIAELIENNYYRHFGKLLHKYNIEFHAEVIYGGTNYPPLDILKTTQSVDLPMFEFWSSTNDDQIVTYNPANGVELNMPSFAVTGYGKREMGSEAYTGMAHYSETPSALKPFGDRAYCAGINQMILHSYVHQPSEKKPGLTLGQFGSHFNRNNTYWSYISEWFNYQSRIQYVLQKGVVFHDVLYYLGDQLPQFITYNESNEMPFGYQFNACNFDILKNRIKVENNKLVLNGNTSYSVLSLPPRDVINLGTLRRIDELVRAGIILYAPKPLKMLSLNDIANNEGIFNELVSKIWGDIDSTSVFSNTYGKGKVYWGIPLSEVLETEKIYPDLNTHQNDSKNLMYTHKKTDGSDVYFVINQQDAEIRREMSFRITGKTPEIWNPESGEIIKPGIFTTDDNYTTLPVQLKPYQALLFIFRNEKPGKYIERVAQDENQIFPAKDRENLKSLPNISVKNNSIYFSTSETEGKYSLLSNLKKDYTIKSGKDGEFIVSDYTGKITFEPGYSTTIQPVEINKLDWLTNSEIPEVRYFSGKANYSISFTFPVDKLQKYGSVYLDLGEFESIAEVKLNGKYLGKVWKTGTKIPVTGILKSENTLEVSVANIYRNRFIGDFRQFGEIRNLWTSSPISNYLNKDLPLKPSGLKGPIKIINKISFPIE